MTARRQRREQGMQHDEQRGQRGQWKGACARSVPRNVLRRETCLRHVDLHLALARRRRLDDRLLLLLLLPPEGILPQLLLAVAARAGHGGGLG